ncbi:MAG: hypothetical protein WBI18_02345 [Candidatus Saccharicenans sp.]
MKKIKILLLAVFISFGFANPQELLFQQNIPNGWKFKEYFPRALYLIQDIPGPEILTAHPSRRLLVMNKDYKIVADFVLEDNWWFGGFLGENILLCYGDETGTYAVKLIDLRGKEIYNLKNGDEGLFLEQALMGDDFALVPDRENMDSGKILIFDGKRGVQRFKLEIKDSSGSLKTPHAFYLIGEGYFLLGMGATLTLKNYSETHKGLKTLWQIQNIGGNIRQLRSLNQNLIAVGYDFEDVNRQVYMAGVAIVNWRTGKILFDKKATRRGNKESPLFRCLRNLSLWLEEDGTLILMEGDRGIALPGIARNKNTGWDEKSVRKVKLAPPKEEILSSIIDGGKVELRGKTVIKDFGSYIRVEKRKLIYE